MFFFSQLFVYYFFLVFLDAVAVCFIFMFMFKLLYQTQIYTSIVSCNDTFIRYLCDYSQYASASNTDLLQVNAIFTMTQNNIRQSMNIFVYYNFFFFSEPHVEGRSLKILVEGCELILPHVCVCLIHCLNYGPSLLWDYSQS